MTDMYHLSGERRRIVWILAGSVVCAAVLAAGWLGLRRHSVDLRGKRDTAEERQDRLQRDLAARPFGGGLDEARSVRRTLGDQWEKMRAGCETFKDGFPLSKQPDEFTDARIDFKITLYDARRRLAEHAAEKSATFPEDLGLEEDVRADENPRERYWQLAGIVQFIELAIDTGIREIATVEPLDAVYHALPGEGMVAAVEVPARFTMHCSYEALTRMMRRLSRGRPFQTLRRVEIEKLGRGAPEALHVDMTAGSMIFTTVSTNAEMRIFRNETRMSR